MNPSLKLAAGLAGFCVLRVRLVVEGDHDPQLPSRVLARFSERNGLPARTLILADEAADTLRIELEFEATADAARQLARRLMAIPSARGYSLAFHALPAGLQQRAA